MTDIILKIAGSAFGVPMNVDLQVAGGPFSFSLKTEQPISINDIWDVFSSQLESVTGVALPTIPPGPWQQVMDRKIFPSLWITPDGSTGNTSAFLLLTLEEELSLGVHYQGHGFDISIEPDITVTGLVIGYDGAGDGLTVKARIKTPVSNNNSNSQSTPAPKSKEQLVNFPFPLPAQNSVSAFKLNYLGIGQRVGPRTQVPASGNPMEIIFKELETQLIGSDPETIITQLARDFYHPDRDWFIAADVEIRELRLRLLFNDPAMYGLEVSIPMTSPPSFFSGLLFEILYQKLGPNLGVYYGALTLPYGMRRIPLEGFILILPGFSAWIYTNGDFRINVGWPVTPDNAIGISFDILTGWAGFYFAKLRSGDNPGALPSVNYNPILEFGIGVAVTAGISISAGPLSASLAVNLSASFQGLLAWENGRSIGNTPDHYWFAGSASISVLLQGSVDLAIIKASVMVSFSVSAGVAFETGYQTVIPISASVSVSVSLKVIFFTIHLSFHTTVNHTFYIGQGPRASLNGPLAPGLNVMSSAPQHWQKMVTHAREYATRQRMQLAGALRPLHDVHEPLRFCAMPGAQVRGTVTTPLDVVFVLQPTVVWDDQQQAAVNLIASLVMACPAPNTPPLASPGAATGYEVLIIKLVKWLLTFVPEPAADQPLSATLRQLSVLLGSGSADPSPVFGGKNGFRTLLEAFFASTIRFQLRGVSAGETPFDTAAVLPMFDILRLDTGGSSIDFSRFNPTPDNYTEALNLYFDNVGLVASERTVSTPDALLRAQASPQEGPAMASYLFGDYFLMIARYTLDTLIQDADQYEKQQETRLRQWAKKTRAGESEVDNPLSFFASLDPELLTGNPTQELNELLDNLAYWSIAGFGSRYLMSGLQLPDPAQMPPEVTPLNIAGIPTSALYLLSGQQYAVSGSPLETSATLRFTPGLEVDWVQFADASPASASAQFDLPTSLPDNPDPQWVFHHTPASPDPITADTLLVKPLPAVLSAPLGYQLKNSLAWQDEHNARTLFPFPQPLLNRLQALLSLPPDQARLQLSLEGSDKDEDVANASINGVATLQIRLSLTQVSTSGYSGASPASPQPKVQPNIYQLNGTDEATRELIYQALQSDLSGATLRLLYLPQGSTEWLSDALDPLALLAKLNLSTLNQVEQVSRMHSMMLATLPVDNDAALVSDAQRFLRLVWELSVVRAPGYYLHYRTLSGQGLPDTLFADTAASTRSPDDPAQKVVDGSQAGTADLMIVVEFTPPATSRLSLAPWHNGLRIDANSQIAALVCQLYDAGGEPLYAWQSALAPGNIGFAANWTPAVAPSPAPSIPVSHLYHLMQYRIDGDGTTYRDSVWSLPVGPTDNATSTSPGAQWQLQQLVPLVPFCTTSSNPYAIIGQTANLSFRLCDMYGNPLTAPHSDSFTPLYSDPLIALGEWPGLKSSYAFRHNTADSAWLRIELEFSPGIVDTQASPGDSPLSQWCTMRDKFLRIVDQLNDPQTHFTLTCSLLNGALPDDPTPMLLTFSDLILGEINRHIHGSPSAAVTSPDAPPLTQTFSFCLPFALLMQQAHDIVDIGVSIGAWRDSDRVDSDVVEKLPQVCQVSYPLLARLTMAPPAGSVSATASPDSDDLSLNTFALNFEQAFAGFDGKQGCLKLAQRAGEQISSDSMQPQDLWSVRFSESQGFNITFASDPLYFALRPLNTIPRSGMVDNMQYNDVDMDAWASRFFSAFDAFLSPTMGVAVALLDAQNQTDYYDRLMQQKQQLAKAIPSGLVPVLEKETGTGDLHSARLRLQQALLENLSSAYTVSTIVQTPVSVTVQGIADDVSPQQAPQLYGSLQQPASVSPESESSKLYQFTPVTVDLATGSQWATSLLTVAKPGDQSSISLPLAYQASYLQHDFAPDHAQDGYVPSSWLKFILPDCPLLKMPITSIGSPQDQAIIPIPLPFEPPMPMLVSQQGNGVTIASPSSSPGSLADEIAQALQWRYQVQVSLDLQDQDQFYFDFTRNLLPNQPMLLSHKQQNAQLLDNLFAALARFTRDWPELSSELDSIQQQAYGNLTGSASTVVERFLARVEEVADSWPTHWDLPRMLAAQLNEIDHFCLSYRGSTLMLLARTEQGGNNPAIWPSVQLGGNTVWQPDRSQARQQQDGWWSLSFTLKQPPVFTRTTLAWEPLAILDYQSAQFTAWTVRNADLVPGQTTNPLFVYQTDSIHFPAPLVPLIERDSLPEVHVAAISLAVLQQIIQQIMTPLTAVSDLGVNPMINLQINYACALVPGAALLMESPVQLINALQLDSASPDTLADQVAEEVWQWYQASHLPELQAQVQIAFTLFGSVNGQQLPLVQINCIPVLFNHL